MRHTWPGQRAPVRVVPVGHPLGMKVSSRGGRSSAVGQIRLGREVWQLPRLGYELWLNVRLARDTEFLNRWSRSNDVEDTSEALVWLRDAGLLVSLTGDMLADQPITSHHRILQTAFGLGNSVDQPGIYRVGDLSGSEVARMDQVSYALWSTADGRQSISELFDQLAKHAGRPVIELYRSLNSSLISLVQAGALLIDLADQQ